MSRDAALYVHVPFCVVKCGYCDFNSFADVDAQLVEDCLAAIERELAMRATGLRPKTIFVGGGTPTWLEPAQLERLLVAIRRHVDLADVVEWSCEANPESCTPEKLQTLLQHGVTRISLGVQSWIDERLRFLDRPHDAAEARQAIELARSVGFADLSFDLIFASPGHDLRLWEYELEQSFELEPEHLSCYHLSFEPGTKLFADRERHRVEEIDEERGRELLLRTRELCSERGYAPYEISNFSRPGRACEHNLNYWRAGNYVGIGPGAASHEHGVRTSNVRPLASYIAGIRDGCPQAEGETLSPSRRAGEAAWLGLRLAEGIDCAEIAAMTGCSPNGLDDAATSLLEEGSLERVEGRLRIPESALPHADTIAAAFLEGEEPLEV